MTAISYIFRVQVLIFRVHPIMQSLTDADVHFSLSLEMIREPTHYGSERFLL